jgi:hypothetical protein
MTDDLFFARQLNPLKPKKREREREEKVGE